jgi:hypothetical protein
MCELAERVGFSATPQPNLNPELRNPEPNPEHELRTENMEV